MTYFVQAVAFRDGPKWVASCRDWDVGVQGDTLDQVHSRLKTCIDIELHKIRTCSISLPPLEIRRKWERRSGVFEPRHSFENEDFVLELAIYE